MVRIQSSRLYIWIEDGRGCGRTVNALVLGTRDNGFDSHHPDHRLYSLSVGLCKIFMTDLLILIFRVNRIKKARKMSVAEWLKAAVFKTVIGNPYHRFKSYPARSDKKRVGG